MKNIYKEMIKRYLREAKKDLKDAGTDEEKRLSLYLIYELNQIIEDAEKGINPNSDLEEKQK